MDAKFSPRVRAILSLSHEEAKRLGIPFYASLPIDPKLAKLCDEGAIESFEGDYLADLSDYLHAYEKAA